jgi:hypothetical protein
VTTKRQLIKVRLETFRFLLLVLCIDESSIISYTNESSHGINVATQTQDGDYNLAYTSQGGDNNSKIVQDSNKSYQHN